MGKSKSRREKTPRREAQVLQWHPAFTAALHIEFEEEAANLTFEEEHLLSKKPMQIDVLVIKKKEEIPVQKNIGRIFRKYNIVEYKSPDDYLSVNDFYKVYGYACFYQADTKKVLEIQPKEITITFVCQNYPRKMLEHLQQERRLAVEAQGKGIYYIYNDEIAMQVLVTSKLSKAENYWLQSLRKNFNSSEDVRELARRYEKKKKIPDYRAVMDIIMRANWDRLKEEQDMCDALKEFFAEELKESKAEGEARLNELLKILLKAKRYADLERATEDKEFREKLYAEFQIA